LPSAKIFGDLSRVFNEKSGGFLKTWDSKH